jgi:hypothetical protein
MIKITKEKDDFTGLRKIEISQIPFLESSVKKSTLFKKVNANPNDPTIRAEFMRWNRAGGRVLNGLTRRRQEEADLYYQPVV